MKRTYLWSCVVALALAGCEVAMPLTETASPTMTTIAATYTPTSAPTATQLPTLTATPTEEPVFTPHITRLTESGCCVQPGWSPDGQQVRFIDKQEGLEASALYGVDVSGGEVEIVSRLIGVLSPEDQYIAYLNEDYVVVVQNQETGIRSIIASEGKEVFFSPNNERLAWQVIRQIGIYGERRSDISIADVNGQNTRQLIAATGGSIIGWLDDDHLLMLSGIVGKDANYRVLFSIAIEGEGRVDLIDNDRIVAAGISPGGEWVWYAIAFSPENPANDGLWVVRRDGTDRQRLDVFGAPQWRDSSHLLIAPAETIGGSHYLLQFDAETGDMTTLTDPSEFQFKVASGEWRVSPTGDHVVFLNATDQALWVFDLPPLAGS